MGLHRCTESECPFEGQTSGRGCGCHKADEQVLREIAAAMLTALEGLLNVAVWDDDFTTKEEFDPVAAAAEAAVVQARAVGIRPTI